MQVERLNLFIFEDVEHRAYVSAKQEKPAPDLRQSPGPDGVRPSRNPPSSAPCHSQRAPRIAARTFRLESTLTRSEGWQLTSRITMSSSSTGWSKLAGVSFSKPVVKLAQASAPHP